MPFLPWGSQVSQSYVWGSFEAPTISEPPIETTALTKPTNNTEMDIAETETGLTSTDVTTNSTINSSTKGMKHRAVRSIEFYLPGDTAHTTKIYCCVEITCTALIDSCELHSCRDPCEV